MSAPALLQQLTQVVGSANVLQQDDASIDLSAWEQDWRGRTRGRALAIVRPGSTQEVAQVVKLCVKSSVSIVPQGGNTGLVEGAIPDSTGTQIVLSLGRMKAVRHIDSANLTVTVEAGCALEAFHEAVENVGFMFPLSMGSKGSCTIGGNLATNAGGTQVVRYGNARNLCLGLEVVTAQGDIWNGLNGLRKDNTGYDLRDLFIGSEGTLGIITAATLQIYPQPATRLTTWVCIPSIEHALELLALAQRHLSAGLTGFEVMGRFAVSLVRQHISHLRIPLFEGQEPYFVLMEISDAESETHARECFERLLETAMEAGCITDAVIAESLTQVRELWEIRESIPLAAYQEGVMAAHDIALTISNIPLFIAQTEEALQSQFPGTRISNFGHLGDGNLHYNVHVPVNETPAAYLAQHEESIQRTVYDCATKLGGTFSAEHGIGRVKTDKMQTYKSAVELDLMRTIKQSLDPAGTMNPACLHLR